jgi:membrane fusion protein (multidrug efflux system)
VVLLVIGCSKPAAVAPPPPIVQVAEVMAGDMPMFAETIGQLDSPQNVQVLARVEGFVEEVLFQEGVEVTQGDPLFRLDTKPFVQRLNAAKGSLAEAEAALNKYRKDVDRLTPLAKVNAIPTQDLDNAIASVEVGKATVLTAQARVESALLDLDYCDVRAPISGLIGAKEVSVGDLVGKGTPTLLATISVLDPIWFYCNVSEVQFLRAESETRRTGKRLEDLPIQLILSDGSVHAETGHFAFIDRAVDPRTGTLRVRASFPNGDKLLRPGMFGRIRVDLGVRSQVIQVPERAVAELQGRHFVWVIGADNQATQRLIKVGEVVEGKWMVLEGLQVGERIVVEGLQKVREGVVVQPKTAEEMAAAAAVHGAAVTRHSKE